MGKLTGSVLTITVFQIMIALFLSEACFIGPGVTSCTEATSNTCSLAGEECIETQPGPPRNSTTGGNWLVCTSGSVTCECYSTCSTNTTKYSFIPGTAILDAIFGGLEPGHCSPGWCLDSATGLALNWSTNPTYSECNQRLYGAEGYGLGGYDDCEGACTDQPNGVYAIDKDTCQDVVGTSTSGTWVSSGWFSAVLAILAAIGVVGIVAGLYVIKSDFAFYASLSVLLFTWGKTYWSAYGQLSANFGSVVPEVVVLLFFIPVMISWFFLVLDWIRGRD